MRSGRNLISSIVYGFFSVADWDMRSGRNWEGPHNFITESVADWDMRSGRNLLNTITLDQFV